ncbi:MAG: hypothetical protein H6523_14270 [Mycolicibacterium sp.]|jgi:hypothetical protein|nr:hypothetical protein [Mycolicibacterium insubricum]MCB9441401.1 hypothetical protein [Mycolicibacterium sp.]MCV7082397.1 hypothetical protein [Mycolicibacterium insubricum]
MSMSMNSPRSGALRRAAGITVAVAALPLLLLAAPGATGFQAGADPGTENSDNQENQNPDNQNNDDQDPNKDQNQAPNLPDNQNKNQNQQSVGGGRFSGTYTGVAHYRTADQPLTGHYSSPCAACDASVGGNTLTWTGVGWTTSQPGPCSPIVTMFVPTSVSGGYAQTIAASVTGQCGQQEPVLGTLTRVGP